MTTPAHQARQARHPIPDNQVYGYQVVWRPRTHPKGYMAIHYGVTPAGNVFVSWTNDPRYFDTPATRWRPAPRLPEAAEYIGHYSPARRD